MWFPTDRRCVSSYSLTLTLAVPRYCLAENKYLIIIYNLYSLWLLSDPRYANLLQCYRGYSKKRKQAGRPRAAVYYCIDLPVQNTLALNCRLQFCQESNGLIYHAALYSLAVYCALQKIYSLQQHSLQ